jgi:uncharacterized membrane protein
LEAALADNSTPRNPHVRPGSKSAKGSLDTPLSGRQRILPKFSPNPDAFGQTTEGFARFMGTPQFLVYMTVFVVLWLTWNTFAPVEWQFDSRALGYTLLTLMLSLQASYAAPLLLLAQNRQDDRDRVSLQQDRQRAERNLSDTEYLTRELASLRIALREVATRDPSAGVHETPRDKAKEKLKDRRDKQRSPRTQQMPRIKSDRNDRKPARKTDAAPDTLAPGTHQRTAPDTLAPDTLQGAGPDNAGAPAHPASPEN